MNEERTTISVENTRMRERRGALPGQSQGRCPNSGTPWWRAPWDWLRRRLSRGENEAWKHVSGKAAQQTSAARKLAAEARESTAKAELLHAKAGIARQEELGMLIENLDRIGHLPDEQQLLAFTKLMASNPEVIAQWACAEEILSRLRCEHGAGTAMLTPDERQISDGESQATPRE